MLAQFPMNSETATLHSRKSLERQLQQNNIAARMMLLHSVNPGARRFYAKGVRSKIVEAERGV